MDVYHDWFLPHSAAVAAAVWRLSRLRSGQLSRNLSLLLKNSLPAWGQKQTKTTVLVEDNVSVRKFELAGHASIQEWPDWMESVNSFRVGSVGLSSALTGCMLLSACAGPCWLTFFFFLSSSTLSSENKLPSTLSFPTTSNVKLSWPSRQFITSLQCCQSLWGVLTVQLWVPPTSPSILGYGLLKGRTEFYLCIFNTWLYLEHESLGNNLLNK